MIFKRQALQDTFDKTTYMHVTIHYQHKYAYVLKHVVHSKAINIGFSPDYKKMGEKHKITIFLYKSKGSPEY